MQGKGDTSRDRPTLSVCCLTGGRRPALLAGILAQLRDSADEIVVGVEEARADEVYEAVAGIADVVQSFPRTGPADKPIAWLFDACSSTWIFNIDDDEVPSPRLVEALPEVVRRTDITHGWIARRWLYPTTDTYLDEAPWNTEFQLRLVLADPRFLQFSDVFHRPVVCHGPSAYLDAPLWHLDSALESAVSRRRKAHAYELERAGMRIAGIAHNVGLYLPELCDEPALAAVPQDDLRAIGGALADRVPPAARGATRGSATEADVEQAWPGPPYAESLYRAELSVTHRPSAMRAGIQYTVDVLVTNRSDRIWRWGPDGRPEIRLAYTWTSSGGDPADEALRLRTPLPADLPPGATLLVPLHVVAPSVPGEYVLELDLVHEHVRWFGVDTSFPVEVEKRVRVAFVGQAERLPRAVADLRLGPEVEPVVVLRAAADRSAFGDYETVDGLHGYLLDGTASHGPSATLIRLLPRTGRVALDAQRRHRARASSYLGLLEASRSTDALVVDGPNWAPAAGFAREWWVLAATALVWRLARRPVIVADDALPDGHGLGRTSLRWVLRGLRSSRRYER